MKPGLAVGIKKTKRFEVDNERTIRFMGEALCVYATPAMVWDVENLCLALLGEYLSSSESSVGSHVAIDHLAPTLLGMSVDVTVTVAALDGRKVSFDVEVKDDLDLVGKGRHVRFVVDLTKQKERLLSKAVKLKGHNTQPIR